MTDIKLYTVEELCFTELSEKCKATIAEAAKELADAIEKEALQIYSQKGQKLT